MSSVFVITVSGVSGAGKSSIVQAVADRLGAASCFYFDDYGEAMQQPEDGLKWIANGSDLTEFVLPEFGRDVEQLLRGETVTTPAGRCVDPAPFLVIEEPFGRGRTDMAGLIDFSVCIDVPLEVALARRLLDVVQRWEGEPQQRLRWIGAYLNTYLFEGMRQVYAAINEGVKRQSDLVIDGLQPVGQSADQIVAAILARPSLLSSKQSTCES